MKNLTLTFIAFFIVVLSYGQTSKTVNSTAGNLQTLLTPTELSEVTNLTITGAIDARDFKTMRDEMPVLAELDLSEVSIVAYTGLEGTSVVGNETYPANTIPEFAFENESWQGKNSLVSVILPESLVAIDFNSFTNCNGLASIVIPPLVTTIGSSSFAACNALMAVSISASVTTIEDGAFTGCPGLITVDPDNADYSSIDGILFNKTQTELLHYPTSRQGEYTIPSSVNVVGRYSFFSSLDLTAITIPTSVASIRWAAFVGCRSLTTVTIPSSVVSIERYAFQHCSGLLSVSIPASVSSIGNTVFQGCTSLSSIYSYSAIPVDLSASPDIFDGVNTSSCILYVPYGSQPAYQTAIEWQDFTIIEEMAGFHLAATTASLGYTEGSTAIVDISSDVDWTATSEEFWLTVSPASGTGENTVTFTAEANPSNGTRDAIVIVSASGVESQTITITQDGAPLAVSPGTLSALLSAEEMATLTKLTLTGTIDARDFKTMRDEMPLLAEIDLSGVEITQYTGAEGTAGTGSITYPAEAIPDQAYYSKTGLAFILFPESITSIGDYSFWGCEGLTSLVLPPLVANIGYAAFNSCYRLTDIVIPYSVVSIGGQVFSFCNALVSVDIPSSVIFLGSRAFSYCPALVNVDVDNPIYSSSEGVLFNKEQTLLISYPISKTGEYNIPPTVTRIENVAFSGYGDLTSITIPESVESIGNYAFWGQSGLGSIYAYTLSPIDLSSSSQVFEYVDKTSCTLYVPYGTSAAYQSANQWQDFENIVEMSGFNLSSTSVLMGYAEGSSGSVDISSDITWTVTSDQSWLLVNPISWTGNGSITFTANLNSNTTTRIANITVSAVGVGSQTIVITQNFNNPPVANAGPDQLVVPGDLVTLYGSASYDIEAGPITYIWTAPNGIKLSSLNVVQPTFTAPKGNPSEPLIFTLVVNDGMLDSQSDEVVINVVDINNPPVVVCNSLTVLLNNDGTYSLTSKDLANLVIGTTDDNDSFNKLLIEAVPNSFSCDDVGVNTQVNVIVTDMNGAYSNCEASIFVIDETGPVFNKGAKSDRKTINTGETYMLPDYSMLFPATDNCGSVSYSQNPPPGAIYSESTKGKISLLASDSYGNSTETIISLTLVVKNLKSANNEAFNEDPNQSNLNVYPNPFKDRIYFELELPENSDILLELFNANGSKLTTIFNGTLKASESIIFEYVPDNLNAKMIFYKLSINEEVFSGKLVFTE